MVIMTDKGTSASVIATLAGITPNTIRKLYDTSTAARERAATDAAGMALPDSFGKSIGTTTQDSTMAGRANSEQAGRKCDPWS